MPVQMPAFNITNGNKLILSEPTNKSSKPQKLNKIISCCWQLASQMMSASSSQTGVKKEEPVDMFVLYSNQVKDVPREHGVPFVLKIAGKNTPSSGVCQGTYNLCRLIDLIIYTDQPRH